jgi:hypothetical protein
MGGTLNWDQYRLAQIWDMVKYESTAVGERQAQAWTNTAELCEDQANQLERAAAQLAQTWVPAPGTAAEGFQDWIRLFTASMRASATAARANSVAISDVTYQMLSARNTISGLVAQGRKYEAAEASQIPPVVKLGEPRPLPPPTDVPRPPDNWQTALDQQAREVMLHTETNVIAQANRVQTPQPFAIPESKTQNQTSVGGSDGGSSGADWTGGSSLSSLPGVSTGSTSTSAVLSPLSIPTMPVGPVDLERDSDTILEGAQAPLPVGSRAEMPVPTTRLESEGLGLIRTPAGVALPPGGIIGGSRPNDGRPISSTGTEFRQQANGGGPRVGSGPSTTPMMSPMGAGRSSPTAAGQNGSRVAGGGRRRRIADADDQWAVSEGGPAVLEPPEEPVAHDPGPGVIGIDR